MGIYNKIMNPSRDRCPLCGEPNSHQLSHCQRCQFRLPWADIVEQFQDAQGEVIKHDSSILPDILPDSRPVPLGTTSHAKPKFMPRCRFCDGAIEPVMKNCPHCRRWLTSAASDVIDVWELGHNERDFEKTSVKPRGCLVGILSFVIPLKLP